MYDELVKALCGCVLSKPCDGCPYYDQNGLTVKCATMNIAAAEGGMSMGVYIRGMEMPKHCGECGVEWCGKWKRLIVAGMPPAKARPEDCPLVPVPPHGRLIDADALTISTAVPLDGNPYQYVHIDNIKAAPTIIPAEEGE